MLAAAACIAAPALAADLAGTVALSSQLIDRGVAIAPRSGAIQGALYWAPARDWSLSASAALDAGSPPRLLQSSFAVARDWTLADDWRLRAGLTRSRYYYTGGRDRWWRVERNEVQASLLYRDLLSLSLSAARLHGSERTTLALDLTLQRPLTQRVAVSAGLGVAGIARYGDGNDRDGYYRYGHLGLSWSRGDWRVDLQRIHAGAGAPRPWNAPQASPWLATLALSF